MTRSAIRLAAPLLIAGLLAGCAAFQPGRSVGRGIDDFNASVQAKSAMLRSEGYYLQGVDLEVTEGIALLSGTAPRLEDKLYAECVTWTSPAVRTVVNEIEIARLRSAGDAARDAVITQQARETNATATQSVVLTESFADIANSVADTLATLDAPAKLRAL